MTDVAKDRAQFAMGMSALNDLSKMCSEYVSTFTAPARVHYVNGGKQAEKTTAKTAVFVVDGAVGFPNSEYDSKFATPAISESGDSGGPVKPKPAKTSVFVSDGADVFPDSEYDAKYSTPAVSETGAFVKRKATAGKGINIGPYKGQAASNWCSEYNEKYVYIPEGDRPAPAVAKRVSVADQAAMEASRRKHRRSYTNVLAAAATKAKNLADTLGAAAEAKKQADDANAARPALAAAISEAATVGAKRSPAPEAAAADEFVEKPLKNSGTMVSEYDTKYLAPKVLEAAENAAAAAKVATMALARETGRCSEYIANFIDVDDEAAASGSTAGMPSGVNDGGAGGAMDWEQELEAVTGTKGGNGASKARRGWTSEYDGSYTESAAAKKAKEIIAGLPSGIDDGGANGAMDWETSAEARKAMPKPAVVESGWTSSEYDSVFQDFDATAMAKIAKNTTRLSKGAEAAMDWTHLPEAPEKRQLRKSGAQSEYDAKYGEPVAEKGRSESEDWVIVDKKEAAEAPAGDASAAFASSYDYAFNNGWKKMAKSKKREYSATGVLQYGLSEYDSNFKTAEEVSAAIKEKRSKKAVKKAPRNKLSVRSTVLDVPMHYRTSEYKRKISAPAYKRVLKPAPKGKRKARSAAGIFSMAPRYPDMLQPAKGRPSEYQSRFDSGKKFKVPAFVKLRMNGKKRFG